MSFADATDPLILAVRTSLATGVPSVLETMLGPYDAGDGDDPTPVRSTYGMPIPMTLAPTLRLPSLICYRNGSSWRSIGKHDYLLTEVVVMYVMETTPAHRLEEHWNLLRCVFQACVETIEADAGDVLELGGVVEFEEERTNVTYGLITDTGHANAYPTFTARFFFTHDDTITAPRVLVDLAQLYLDVWKQPEDVLLAQDAVVFEAPTTSYLVTDAGDRIVTDDGDPIIL